MKNCPFCGGKPRIAREWDSDTHDGRFVFVECSDCRSSSRKHYVSGSNDCPLFYEEVRNDWEKRV